MRLFDPEASAQRTGHQIKIVPEKVSSEKCSLKSEM